MTSISYKHACFLYHNGLYEMLNILDLRDFDAVSFIEVSIKRSSYIQKEVMCDLWENGTTHYKLFSYKDFA